MLEKKLRPGHFLEWKNGKIATVAYWQCAMEPQHDLMQSEAEAKLDKLLRESLKEHLVAVVPLGIWLSGGVDSSTILHYASKLRSVKLKSFSISFVGRSFDERPYIGEMVERYDTEHHELDLNRSLDLSAAIEDFSYYTFINSRQLRKLRAFGFCTSTTTITPRLLSTSYGKFVSLFFSPSRKSRNTSRIC